MWNGAPVGVYVTSSSSWSHTTMTGTDSHARPSFTTWRYTTTSPVDHMRPTLGRECEDCVSGKLGIPPLPRRLVQHHGRRHRDVQRLDGAGERERHLGVA